MTRRDSPRRLVLGCHGGVAAVIGAGLVDSCCTAYSAEPLRAISESNPDDDCNHVSEQGGYTSMTPAATRR